MASIRMGQNNRITAERWHKVKGALASGMSNKEIMERYHIGATTLGRIKNTDTFYEYRLKTEKIRSCKMDPVMSSAVEVYFEDFGPGAKCYNKKVNLPHVYNDDQKAVNVLGRVVVVSLVALASIAIVSLLAMMGMPK